MTIYNKTTILNLLALVAQNKKEYVIVDKYNAKNFIKIAKKAKHPFKFKSHRNGSITIFHNLP